MSPQNTNTKTYRVKTGTHSRWEGEGDARQLRRYVRGEEIQLTDSEAQTLGIGTRLDGPVGTGMGGQYEPSATATAVSAPTADTKSEVQTGPPAGEGTLPRDSTAPLAAQGMDGTNEDTKAKNETVPVGDTQTTATPTAPTTNTTTTAPNPKVTSAATETPSTDYDVLASMTWKEAVDLVKGLDSEADLKAALAAEEGPEGKGRTSVIEAINEKLDNLEE